MNAALYIFSYLGLATTLALAAWSFPRVLWLPGPTRLILGAAATPLLLPVLTLALTLIWPGAPRWLLLAWPGMAATAIALARPRAVPRVLRCAIARCRRMRFGLAPLLISLAGGVLFFTATVTVAGNAQRPLSEHDALIYFNEARTFARAPAWSTFARMANPAEPAAIVSGHTHTWLFPTYVAQALFATTAPQPGQVDDFVARAATQGVLLVLMAAVGGLTFAVTRRSLWLAVAATAAVPAVRWVGYITAATSIDAFRILPLVLAATALVSTPRTRAGWIVAAALLALSSAAHTLNIVFVALLALARVLAGIPRGRMPAFWLCFAPATVVLTLPVAAHYAHLWRETGRLFGHGMHYPFYAGSPLQDAAVSRVVFAASPTLGGVVRELVATHGAWCTLGPLFLLLVSLGAAQIDRGVRFIGLTFVLWWLVPVGGAFVPQLRSLTWAFLDNFRYPLPTWLIGLPLAAASVRLVGGRLPPFPGSVARLGSIAGSLIAVWLGTVCIQRWWPISYNASVFLEQGERLIAAEASRLVGTGETWMTDRNTVAYYSERPPIFLYTPAGHRWIRANTAEEAWALICAHRVRLVAFNNRAPNWWPRTALYDALTRPGHAERRDLARWQLFYVRLPGVPGTAPETRQPR